MDKVRHPFTRGVAVNTAALPRWEKNVRVSASLSVGHIYSREAAWPVQTSDEMYCRVQRSALATADLYDRKVCRVNLKVQPASSAALSWSLANPAIPVHPF